jgi:predicted lipoprotein with Yx(FWY)xxD motif
VTGLAILAAAVGLAAHPSPFGTVVFDQRGQALYAFTRDAPSRSSCTGACLAAWPPFLAPSGVRALKGVDAKKISTFRRRDGRRQVAYAGHPLYFYVGDPRGRILCQNVREFGGLWLVVHPSGALVR